MKISEYFTDKEMKCKGASCCGGAFPMDRKFMDILDELRRQTGPINVNSGFRCPTHNSSIKNSSKKSQHMLGRAADITCNSVDLEYLSEIAKELNLYVIKYDTFIHVDGRFL